MKRFGGKNEKRTGGKKGLSKIRFLKIVAKYVALHRFFVGPAEPSRVGQTTMKGREMKKYDGGHDSRETEMNLIPQLPHRIHRTCTINIFFLKFCIISHQPVNCEFLRTQKTVYTRF